MLSWSVGQDLRAPVPSRVRGVPTPLRDEHVLDAVRILEARGDRLTHAKISYLVRCVPGLEDVSRGTVEKRVCDLRRQGLVARANS